jgi:hypothetical protein
VTKLKRGKKTGLYYFNIKDIRSWRPCYDPATRLPENFRGTALTILKDESIPAADRLWTVLRTDLCSEKLMRLFAVWSYRQTLVHTPNQDPRFIEAANVAERYAHGEATAEELSAADWAARSAARSAAYSAARSAARSAQINKLIEMFLAEGKERVAK